MDNDKTLIIIPCYNEEKNIESVIRDLKDYKEKNKNVEILFVDDCSKDKTVDILKQEDMNFISLPVNLGYNYAVQTGIKYGLKNDYENFILMDGDGQHLVSEIDKLFNEYKNGSDIVIGSRFENKFKSTYKIPIMRKFGMIFFSLITSLLIRKKVKDTSSGFQLFNKKVADYLVKIYETKYPDAEVIILLNLLKFKYKEVPVIMKERIEGQSMISSLNYPIRSIIGIIIAFGRYFYLRKRSENA